MSALASDSDMIAVPRGLLASALYCVRHHAGIGSKTYQDLSALALSPAPQTFAGMTIADAMAGTYHPGDDA